MQGVTHYNKHYFNIHVLLFVLDAIQLLHMHTSQICQLS
jgi:hypothetical protein